MRSFPRRLPSPDISETANPHGANVLVWPSSMALWNVGDLAMLQVTVRRIHAFLERPNVFVYTLDPERLRAYCPQTYALSPDCSPQSAPGDLTRPTITSRV